MQHLDEGTIHAWLDGALPPDEAARVEAHVAECAECAAKVAEARGFIAASSRILTALDDVPRWVIPASSRRQRINRIWLQAAAVLLVVATGSLLVVRNRPADKTQPRAAVVTAPKNVALPAQQVTAAVPANAAVASVVRHSIVTPAPRASVPKLLPGTSTGSGNKSVAATVVAPQPPGAMLTVESAPAVVPRVPVVAESQQRSHDTTLNITLSRDVNRLQAVVTTGVATGGNVQLRVSNYSSFAARQDIELAAARYLVRDYADTLRVIFDPATLPGKADTANRPGGEDRAIASILRAKLGNIGDVRFCTDDTPHGCHLRNADVLVVIGIPVVSGDSATIKTIEYEATRGADSLTMTSLADVHVTLTLKYDGRAWKVVRSVIQMP